MAGLAENRGHAKTIMPNRLDFHFGDKRTFVQQNGRQL